MTTVRNDPFDDELLPRSCEIKRRDLLPPGSVVTRRKKRTRKSKGIYNVSWIVEIKKKHKKKRKENEKR